jgi:hypothetical protein
VTIRQAPAAPPPHDPDVCGLDDPCYGPPLCPACRAEWLAAPPPPPAPHPPALALARRLRREGAKRRDAEREALALYGWPATTDRGEAVLAAVAAAYDPADATAEAAGVLSLILRVLSDRPDVARALALILRRATEK